MSDTTVRRLTIHPPDAGEGSHSLVWSVVIDDDALATDDHLLDVLCDRFRAEVGELLAAHAAHRELDVFLGRCRFSLADLQARDNRPGIAAARNELMWHLRQAGWPLTRIGALLDRHHSTVLDGCRKHAADRAIARTRESWKGVAA